MKRNWIILVICCALSSCLNTTDRNNQSEPAPVVSNEPVDSSTLTSIQWIDSSLNLGSVSEGELVNVKFRFRNTGDKPLVIKSVRASCGCTTPEPPTRPYAPGEEGEITASFNSANRVGLNRKEIFVSANTKKQLTHVLEFQVEVKKPADK